MLPCRLLPLSPRAGRGRLASGTLAERSKSGEGACPQAQTRGYAPSPGFLRFARNPTSPRAAGRGGASGFAVRSAGMTAESQSRRVGVEALVALDHGLARNQLNNGSRWIHGAPRRIGGGQRRGEIALQVVHVELTDRRHLRDTAK